MFEYQKKKESGKGGNRPKWVVLEGVPAADVEGIDMGTAVHHGYYGQTNK